MTDLPAIVGFVGYAALCALILLALWRCYRRPAVKASKVPLDAGAKHKSRIYIEKTEVHGDLPNVRGF